MKFSLSWLKDHLDTDEPLDKLADKLTMIGLEVEHIDDKAALLKPFTIAHVLTAVQHPNADRLRVCTVDVGSGAPLQIVCGAPNARAGLKTVFAKPGTYIPAKDFTISVGTIRGVESQGMLCSAGELGAARLDRRHHRIAGRCAGRRLLSRLGQARRSGDRDQPHAEPSGLHRRVRHRARS